MANLIYGMISSLDGYIEDTEGKFNWAEPNESLHTYINNLYREIGTYLYGRRMYQTMMVWETDPSFAAADTYIRHYAQIWQAADKIVYSKTLEGVATRRTRLARDFDPEAVRQLKATAGHDLLIAGPHLAAQAFRAGLVDECHLFLVPIILGGGKACLPENVRLAFELAAVHRFDNGMLHLRYQAKPGLPPTY